MMKSKTLMKRLMALLTCCCCAFGLHAEHVIFEIGKQNGSPSEFALYPDRYKQFLIDFSGVKREPGRSACCSSLDRRSPRCARRANRRVIPRRTSSTARTTLGGLPVRTNCLRPSWWTWARCVGSGPAASSSRRTAPLTVIRWRPLPMACIGWSSTSVNAQGGSLSPSPWIVPSVTFVSPSRACRKAVPAWVKSHCIEIHLITNIYPP